jgi:hypothetical protein
MASNRKHGKSKVEEAHYELPDAQTLQEAGELLIKVSLPSIARKSYALDAIESGHVS